MKNRVVSFGRFWWDFVVGDDWRLAAGALAALATAALVAHAGVTAWWITPTVVIAVLVARLSRATPRRPT